MVQSVQVDRATSNLSSGKRRSCPSNPHHRTGTVAACNRSLANFQANPAGSIAVTR